MLALCKLVDVSVCASQAAARKAQPLWQQLGFQAKINERKKIIFPIRNQMVGKVYQWSPECCIGVIIGFRLYMIPINFDSLQGKFVEV